MWSGNPAICAIHLDPRVIRDMLIRRPSKARVVDKVSSAQDLKRAMPELSRGLQQLLDFEGDAEATFARSFEVEFDYFGELRSVELKPGGAAVPVTNDNRAEFVRCITDYYLNKSVEEQFSAFASGFLQARTPSSPIRSGCLMHGSLLAACHDLSMQV